MASTKAITALRRFSTCDVGDALIKLHVPYGGYLHGLRMFSPNPNTSQPTPTKIFGPAYTVQMVPASDTTSPRPDIHFADGAEKDSVVFISQPKGMYSACWGGLMSTRAQYLGAKGVVIDGCFRDVGEHREMGFPVGLPIRLSFHSGSSINVYYIPALRPRTLNPRLHHVYPLLRHQGPRAVHFARAAGASDHQPW